MRRHVELHLELLALIPILLKNMTVKSRLFPSGRERIVNALSANVLFVVAIARYGASSRLASRKNPSIFLSRFLGGLV